MSSLEHSIRPWGEYQVLYDGDDCKIKRITVYSGHRLSLQYHLKREELWHIISGDAKITVDTNEFELLPQDDFFIFRGTKHRIENIGKEDLVFIEIQTGDYFGEDDIIRIEDDYGR